MSSLIEYPDLLADDKAARKLAKKEKRRLRREEEERQREKAEQQQGDQQQQQDGEPDEEEENASKRRKKDNHEEAEATTAAAAAEAAAGNKGNADEAQHIRQVFGFTGPAVKQQQQGGGFSFGFEAAKDQEVQQKLERIMAVDDGTTPPSTYVPCRVSRPRSKPGNSEQGLGHCEKVIRADIMSSESRAAKERLPVLKLRSTS